jgi:hypothetical protein
MEDLRSTEVPSGTRDFPLSSCTWASGGATDEGEALAVRRERKIRGADHRMCWYESEGIGAEPPQFQAQRGDLFLRTPASGNGTDARVWLWDADRWDEIKAGHVHPLFPGRVLYVLPQGGPRWITMKTLATYKGKGLV